MRRDGVNLSPKLNKIFILFNYMWISFCLFPPAVSYVRVLRLIASQHVAANVCRTQSEQPSVISAFLLNGKYFACSSLSSANSLCQRFSRSQSVLHSIKRRTAFLYCCPAFLMYHNKNKNQSIISPGPRGSLPQCGPPRSGSIPPVLSNAFRAVWVRHRCQTPNAGSH